MESAALVKRSPLEILFITGINKQSGKEGASHRSGDAITLKYLISRPIYRGPGLVNH